MLLIKGNLRVVVFTVVLLVSYWIFQYMELEIPFHEGLLGIILFYCIQSISIHSLFEFGQKRLEVKFPILVIGAFTLRLITAFMAVVILLVVGVSDPTVFIINFFAVYLLYFVFEIYTVLSNLRSNLN